MPSFDVVSEVDKHEAQNAVDQASRELTTRYDFKGVDASFELNEFVVTIIANEEFQITQMQPMLENAMTKRGIKISCLEYGDVQGAGKQVKMTATMRQGIDKELAKKITKLIKESKLKVQSSIQGETVRVQGKNRDDLQSVMQLLKNNDTIDLPLNFKNMKS